MSTVLTTPLASTRPVYEVADIFRRWHSVGS